MALTANPLTHRFRYEPGADTTEPIQSAPDTLIRTPVRTPGLTQHAGPLDWTIEADQILMNPSATSRHFLRVSISAPSISRMVRPPLNLVVLLDTSGSMSTNNKLNRTQDALSHLWSVLRPDDRFTLVTFADNARVLHPNQFVGSTTTPPIGISLLQAEGGTNLYAGLEKAYRELKIGDTEQNLDRLLLISDGKANIGPSSQAQLKKQVTSYTNDGYTVSAIGIGTDYNERTLRMITDIGGGSYYLATNPNDVATAMEIEMSNSASIAARETAIEFSFPQGIRPIQFFGWFPEMDEEKTRIHLGELYSSLQKQIFIEVDITPDALPGEPIVNAILRYVDPTSMDGVVQQRSLLLQTSPDKEARQNSVHQAVLHEAEEAKKAWEVLQWLDKQPHQRSVQNDVPPGTLSAALKDFHAIPQTLDPASAQGKRWFKELEYRATDALRSKQ